MAVLRDFHVHTNFSDGRDTPEAMVRAAIAQGMAEIGFSDHSPTSFDDSYCVPFAEVERYRAEILRLKELYSDAIIVRLGIEQDYYSDAPTDGYEYVIGSVHYARFREEDARGGTAEAAYDDVDAAVREPACIKHADGFVYVPVDESREVLEYAAERYCGGDVYALCENYFAAVADVVSKTGCDIIGHFDLVAKHNEKMPLFDESDERYVCAWKAAADRLLETGIPFEINTGAMSRGAKTDPYPTMPVRAYLAERGATFLLSSDSHRTDTIRYAFDRYEPWAAVNRAADAADPYVGPDAPEA